MAENRSIESTLPVILEVISGGGEFRMYPLGSSMSPGLKQGKDSVGLRAPKELKRGDVVLYRRENGLFVLHRIIRIKEDGSLVMCGDSQYVPEEIPRESVIAVAYRIFKGERCVMPQSLEYRLTFFAVRVRASLLLFAHKAKAKLKKMLFS